MIKNLSNKQSVLIVFLIIAISAGVSINDNTSSNRRKFENYLNKEYKKLEDNSTEDQDIQKPDRPDQANIRNYFMTIDPELKTVPSYRSREAYEKVIKHKGNFNLKSGTETIKWHEEPANMGGRTRTLMFDPNNTDKAWAGSVTGGLWYNNNIFGDEPWIPVNDLWENLSISSMAYDPNNIQVFYVGTGESQTSVSIYRESTGRGFGLMKSTDGGSTWDFIESTKNWAFVSDIIVRNENGTSVIYAGVLSGYYQGNHQSQPSDGLYRSEDDGASWQQVLPNIEGKNVPYAPSDIELLADNSKIFVGTTYNLNNDGASCILSSTNGTDWEIYSDHRDKILNSNEENIPGRVILTSSPSHPEIVIAGIAAGEPGRTGGFVGYNCPFILKSTNKGESWNELNLPSGGSGWATLGWHALTFAIQPNNPDVIWAGGLDLWRSINGGLSWTKYSAWRGMYYRGYSPTYVHADQHKIVYQPGSSKKMLFGNDGGVFCTLDGSQLNPQFFEKNKSYNTLQYYSCAIHPQAGATHYIGGLQDNATAYYRGDPIEMRNYIGGGDGALCFIDEDDPLYMIISTYYNAYTLYVAPVSEGAIKTGSRNTGNGTFINPADYDSKKNTLFANVQAHNSSSGADRLLRIKNFLTSRDVFYTYLNTGTTVPFSCVKVSPHAAENTSTVYVGTESGRLFMIKNAHYPIPQVTEIGSHNFPTGYISSIDVGLDENNLVVTFSNYGVTSIFYSGDGGTSWTAKEFNLPDMPVRTVLFHPENDDQVMIGTDFGIWTTRNIKQDYFQWTLSSDGFPLVRVDQIKIRKSDNTVLAGTHGRGMFTGIWEKDETSGSDNTNLSDEEIKIYPNPTNENFKIEFFLNKPNNITIIVNDNNGRILIKNTQENFSGKYNQIFDIRHFSPGIYFIRTIIGKTTKTKKIIVY